MTVSRRSSFRKIDTALRSLQRAAFGGIIAGWQRQGRWDVFCAYAEEMPPESGADLVSCPENPAYVVLAEGIYEGMRHDPAMCHAILIWCELHAILDG